MAVQKESSVTLMNRLAMAYRLSVRPFRQPPRSSTTNIFAEVVQHIGACLVLRRHRRSAQFVWTLSIGQFLNRHLACFYGHRQREDSVNETFRALTPFSSAMPKTVRATFLFCLMHVLGPSRSPVYHLMSVLLATRCACLCVSYSRALLAR